MKTPEEILNEVAAENMTNTQQMVTTKQLAIIAMRRYAKLYHKLQRKQPFKCPICGGTGEVPEGFYRQNMEGIWTTSGYGKELCRTCNGTGIVWG